MRWLKTIVAVAVLGLIIFVGWRVGSAEIANMQFQGDLRDMATQGSFRYGNSPARSEDELRDAVIRKANEDGITLTPEQVTVRTSPTYLAADYSVQVDLPKVSFSLHFTPSSDK